MTLFKIKNSRYDYRKKTKHIVLMPIANFYQKGSYILKDIFIGTYRYTGALWQNYFHKELLMEKLPYHYFVELLNKDYTINVGCPFICRSTFLKELSDLYIIEYEMRDAILIAIQENFHIDTFDVRMAQHLCDKIISPYMYEYSIEPRNIVTFDSILKPNYKELMEKNRLRYEFIPMSRFDMINFKFILENYWK